MTLKQNKTEGKSVENGGKKGEKRGEGGEGELLELSMDTWLTVCKEDELPQAGWGIESLPQTQFFLNLEFFATWAAF